MPGTGFAGFICGSRVTRLKNEMLHDDVARQAPEPERADPSPQETNHHQDQSDGKVKRDERDGVDGARTGIWLD